MGLSTLSSTLNGIFVFPPHTDELDVMAAEFNNVQKSNQIGIHIGIGIFDAVAHSDLGGKVDNLLWFEINESFCQSFSV